MSACSLGDNTTTQQTDIVHKTQPLTSSSDWGRNEFCSLLLKPLIDQRAVHQKDLLPATALYNKVGCTSGELEMGKARDALHSRS